MMYSGIFIVYNPKSTGDSERIAKEAAKRLRKNLDRADIKLMATKHAGHGREIAHDLASKHKSPLIISSSGDGGYNEIVNGVMEAGNSRAICAVLPAGNANDHSRTMHDKPLVDRIAENKTGYLDLIKLTISDNNKQKLIYAHSYVGLGITPVVAAELNKNKLSAYKEALIIIRTFSKYRPFKIVHNGKTLKLDSLIFGNINQMAKILTLAPDNKATDGKFEIIPIPSGHKLRLIKLLIKAAAYHLEDVKSAKKYEFKVVKRMPIQADGEVSYLKQGAKVKVEIAPAALRTIL